MNIYAVFPSETIQKTTKRFLIVVKFSSLTNLMTSVD